MKRKLPAFLEDFDTFSTLMKWMKANVDEGRHWILQAWKFDFVKCELTWMLGEQVAHIVHVAATGEEAVYIALDDFYRAQPKEGVLE